MSVSAVKNSAVSSIAVAALLLLDERCDATVCLSPKPAHEGGGELLAHSTIEVGHTYAADAHQVRLVAPVTRMHASTHALNQQPRASLLAVPKTRRRPVQSTP